MGRDLMLELAQGNERLMDEIKNEIDPTLCWYPSALYDIGMCHFIKNARYSLNLIATQENNNKQIAKELETQMPDYFIFTDIAYPKTNEAGFLNEILEGIATQRTFAPYKYYRDNALEFDVVRLEKLNDLNAAFNAEFHHEDIAPSTQCVYYAEIVIRDKNQQEYLVKIFFVGVQNEVFCVDYFLRHKAEVNFIINKVGQDVGLFLPVFGPSGMWRLNVLQQLHCRYFVSTIGWGENNWNEFDDDVINKYPVLGGRINRSITWKSICLPNNQRCDLNIGNGCLLVEINGITHHFPTLHNEVIYEVDSVKEDDGTVIISNGIGINRVILD
jgi:hypothetical protein